MKGFSSSRMMFFYTRQPSIEEQESSPPDLSRGAVLQDSLNHTTAIRMGSKLEATIPECIHDKVKSLKQAFTRQTLRAEQSTIRKTESEYPHLNALLNDVVPILVVHTIKNLALEFLHQGDQSIHWHHIQSFLDDSASVHLHRQAHNSSVNDIGEQ